MATIPVTVSHIFGAHTAAAAEALITQGYELTPADEALLEIDLGEIEMAGVEELLSHPDRERLFWRVKASLGGAKLFAEGDWAAQVLATLHPSVPLAKMSPSQVPSFAGLESIAAQLGEGSQCTNEGYKIAAAGAGGTNGGEGSLVGERLGNYLILSKLGTGGMATVYEAFHEGLGKKVAIKVVSSEFANDPNFRERFMREVDITKKVVHPHVVEYEGVDVDPATNSFYLVVEYLNGRTLEDTLKKAKPLPWERARDILLQISDGLEAIHRAGIIHRDLKPGNIMLIERDGKEDFVKIVDLGIAKPSSKAMEQKLTQQGLTMGTPHYMSPEQVMAKELDHRSDLYALGVMMYEMLTGGLPFDGDTSDNIKIKHVTEKPPLPSKKNPGADISREVEAVILRALEKEPANRFQSAGEMAEAIRAIADGGKKEKESPVIRVSDVVERFSAGSQKGVTGIKNPFPWRWVGVASALLAVGLGGFFLGRRRETIPEESEQGPPAQVVKKEVQKPDRGEVATKAAKPEEKKDGGIKKAEGGKEGEQTPREVESGKESSKSPQEPEVKPKAAESEKEKALERRIAGLIRQLDSDETVEKALTRLFEIGRPAVPALIKALKKDGKENIRTWAANILGAIGGKSAIPALIEALKDESPFVRNIAADALGKIGDKSAVPALTEALNEESFVGKTASEALQKIQPVSDEKIQPVSDEKIQPVSDEKIQPVSDEKIQPVSDEE